MAATDTFMQDFAAREVDFPGNDVPWLAALRREAARCFAGLGLPTRRREDWRYARLEPLGRIPFRFAGIEEGLATHVASLADRTHGYAGTCKMVFVNGRYAPGLSSIGALPEGVRAGSLLDAIQRDPEALRPHLGSLTNLRKHPLAALNTAFFVDGFLLHLPRGASLDEPIQLVFISAPDGVPTVCHPRVLVVAGQGSRASLIESYVGSSGPSFTNAVCEIVAGPGSVLEHCRIQEEDEESFHVGTLRVHQDRDSRVASHVVSLGGRSSRNDLEVLLAGPGAEVTLNGLYVATGGQSVDNHTRIEHRRPRCRSEELYKGVIDDRATGSFTGLVLVHEDAQRTDASQNNRNLLLSDDATANSRPQLEIYADDVKCSHGSTTGQLDAGALFYLRSRGIPASEARNILTRAFTADVGRRIPFESVRARIETLVTQKLCVARKLQEVV